MFSKWAPQAFLIAILSLLFSSCGDLEEKDGIACDFYEEHFGGLTWATYSNNEKAAQRFNVVKGFNLKTITLELDVFNSDSISLSVYKAVLGQTTPAGGNLVAQSTIESSQVTDSGKVDFEFASSPFLGGESFDYYLILESTGGSFRMQTQNAAYFDIIGEIWRFNSSTWTKDSNLDFSFSLKGDCSLSPRD